MSAATVPALRDSLLRGMNRDGGWGYQSGNTSRLEPTCWALMALSGEADSSVLAQWPSHDGLLLERAGGSPNYGFHGLALLTLRALKIEHSASNQELLRGIQAVKGKKLPNTDLTRQNNNLQAWSWIADTFSWVEPTAWCLLALKGYRGVYPEIVEPSRIDVAERLLLDRHCVGGGWNYGNSNVYGQSLKAFVPTTALGLMALQDRRKQTEVQQAVEFLERNGTHERSGIALSLATIALNIFGSSSTAPVRDAAMAQISTTITFGNQMAAAMLLFTLRGEGNHAPFRI